MGIMQTNQPWNLCLCTRPGNSVYHSCPDSFAIMGQGRLGNFVQLCAKEEEENIDLAALQPLSQRAAFHYPGLMKLTLLSLCSLTLAQSLAYRSLENVLRF
jgi:hypothetical protein